MAMFRISIRTAQNRIMYQNMGLRMKNSSSCIRSTYIEYFCSNHNHRRIKSSAVVPLCDPTVPFVNAGMNQFKGVFLGNVEEPCPRAVNSQKCVRVGGKHNDLDVVGTDGHHHTFFEMLGNWSFGDYYKKEACGMAWDLLLGPYKLTPEDLVVTYFAGDHVLGLIEDRECRDIWKSLGVPESRMKAMDAKDNFWEMGATGPCGPCTEIHYVNPDGSLTEIWNIVFIQCNREANGSITPLRRHHVDTGMGLERMTALLQGVSSNYDTDLFKPIIKAIERNSSNVPAYRGRFDSTAGLDCAYRRLADHARMISVCLADGVFPATSLNLKQIMRKSLKISEDVFCNRQLLPLLYDEVVKSLGDTYPELISREKEAKLIIKHEEMSYAKMRADLSKKWKNLHKQYPEVENLSDVELPGFPLGYKEFKETMAKLKSNLIPAELVFKLYDTHGFQEEIIERIAKLNHLEIDKNSFLKLLEHHKSRHKAAFKEQSSKRGILFDEAIQMLIDDGVQSTNDKHKYKYSVKDNIIQFEPLETKIVAILNEDCEWIDYLEPYEDIPYYLVTKDTSFYCEEGGQMSDSGIIYVNKDISFNVNSVFKIRDFVFHKGHFAVNKTGFNRYMKNGDSVIIEIDSEKRLKLMKNHTAVHLLNASIRHVLSDSAVCQIGANVSDKELSLNLSVYGQKISHEVVLEAQDLIRKCIQSNIAVETRVIDSVQLSREESVVTVPGEIYPETGLRLVHIQGPLQSKELCCGTHVPATGYIEDVIVTVVKGAGGQTPNMHAVTGEHAKQVRELFSRAQKLHQIAHLVDPEHRALEVAGIKRHLTELCGSSGAPHGELAQCLASLDGLQKRASSCDSGMHAIANAEVREAAAEAASEGRGYVVHFMRCSYLMRGADASRALRSAACAGPALLLGCAGGVITAACHVPKEMVSESFTAERWLRSVLPVFQAELLPPSADDASNTYAEMAAVSASLITCEQQVQDAMRIAIKFAKSHLGPDKEKNDDEGSRVAPSQDRRRN